MVAFLIVLLPGSYYQGFGAEVDITVHGGFPHSAITRDEEQG